MLVMMLVSLPDVIIKYFQSFLCNDDIHYLMNCNRFYFSSLKYETIYFSLNKKKSQEYVEDERFRERILSKVKDGSQQIALKFDKKYEVPDIRDIVAHKIKFGRHYSHLLKYVSSQVYYLPPTVKEIPFLPMLEDLELDNCVNIRDFSSLSHVKRLDLSDATHLTDLTPLQNIPHLTLTNCPNIQNYSILSNKHQKSLSINRSAITDVSFLRNIQEVLLSSCDQLIDVTPLNGIKNLVLMDCFGIQNISGLGNHHRLTIFYCHSIDQGYECFRTVLNAVISGLEIPDLNVFQEVKSLTLTFFDSMERQLFLLKDIPDLTLTSFFNNQKQVYDVSHLRNKRLSFYDDIINICNTSFPSQILHLELINCDQIVKIINEGQTSIFYHLQSLRIISCSIEHVNGLGDIPTIILETCLKLHDIRGLGRNRCVELQYCPGIHNVNSLTAVPMVTIKNCEKIVDYSCLSLVPRLKICNN